MAQDKLYTLKGTIRKVFEPREVKMTYGGKAVTKYVTDCQMHLEAGAKVKVSFWDTDVSEYEGKMVTISSLAYKGKYKDVPQWSSTKTTKIHAEGDAAEEADEELDEMGLPKEDVPEGAVSEDEEQAPPVMTAKKASAILKGEDVPKVSAPYTVHPKAVEQTVVLAETAMDIAGNIAVKIVKADPVAFQALFATIFIQLGLADWKERQKK